MKRRAFISLIGGAAAAWPLGARAQQPERMRRIGILMSIADDADSRIGTLRRALQQAGWAAGRNLRIDERWGAGDPDRIRVYAAELVGLKPDVMLVNDPRALAAVQEVTRSIPIVFVATADPVGLGLIESMARPGGNITGFTIYEDSIVGKLLEALTEIAPRVSRVPLIHHPDNVSSRGFQRSLETAASTRAVRPVVLPVRDRAEIERAIGEFAAEPDGGLVIPPDVTTVVHRELIIALADRHRLPAVYGIRLFVTGGGLMSYGVDIPDLYRRAASYVDRILRGEKPGELPVQAPNKFELVVNLKTARALGLTVPATVLLRADEVIE